MGSQGGGQQSVAGQPLTVVAEEQDRVVQRGYGPQRPRVTPLPDRLMLRRCAVGQPGPVLQADLLDAVQPHSA